MFDCRRTCRNLLTAALLAAGVWTPGGVARAQAAQALVARGHGQPRAHPVRVLDAVDVLRELILDAICKDEAP